MYTWRRPQPAWRQPLAPRGPVASYRETVGDQLESLLDQVWLCEREWALDDRIELGWRRQLAASGHASPRRAE